MRYLKAFSIPALCALTFLFSTFWTGSPADKLTGSHPETHLASLPVEKSASQPVGSLQDTTDSPSIVGTILDRQGSPVIEAHVSARLNPGDSPLAESLSQPDGRFVLVLPDPVPDELIITIVRDHFNPQTILLDADFISLLKANHVLVVPEITLTRRIDAAFWIASAVFALVLILIALGDFHNTLAALVGVVILFAFSYIGTIFNPDFFIFTFNGALRYIDWNVIFLIMGMMIVIAVVERTGIFQWLALTAFRISGGRTWLLLIILMIITGVASAFLDNVTTMLLMTPITVQIALSLGLSPLVLLIPEVFASNIAGISTLVGTPTNILIGSYANISFTDFLINLTPGVVLALIALIIYCQLLYRRDLAVKKESKISDLLLEKLAERAQITEPDQLKKAGWVGAGMIILFIFGELIHLVPAVTALMGATALLVWIRPDIDEMIEAVDWTTLVFFIGLFICVGAIQEVGLISLIADTISRLVGDNLVLAMLVILWLSALLSTLIANIPFTAAMLPVIGYLTLTIPGAQNKVLFYCLSVGSAMGGNGSLIGASANLVTAGISERAGYPITYVYFMKKGMPALVLTVGMATIWLLIRFL